VDSLVAAAIHDAKNALHALGVALDEAGREHASPALDRARAMAARVSAQLVELLALHRNDQGSLRLAVDDHDLKDFLQDTLAELERPQGLVVYCDDKAALAIGAWAFDAYQVKFVLLDALRNALRHAGNNVRLAVAAEPGGGIRFTVSDDGPGFSDEVLRGGTAAMTSDSSGLGLTFARLIADAHATPEGRRGRVELANDGGARFSLVLP
jgi:signal transduction histidine kinase